MVSAAQLARKARLAQLVLRDPQDLQAPLALQDQLAQIAPFPDLQDLLAQRVQQDLLVLTARFPAQLVRQGLPAISAWMAQLVRQVRQEQQGQMALRDQLDLLGLQALRVWTGQQVRQARTVLAILA